MNTEAFVQGVVVFLICVTFTNIVINFMLLCFETLKECSIMDGENQKKSVYSLTKVKERIRRA